MTHHPAHHPAQHPAQPTTTVVPDPAPAPPSPARRGVYAVLAVPVAWGLVSAWVMPRGPVSTVESLVCLAAGVAIGLVCGRALRTRWAMLGAPLAFVVAYELARAGVSGPTVDLPRASTYGLIAVVTGRGFHGLVALLPMVWAAAIGAGMARGRVAGGTGRARATRWLRRTVATLTGVALAAFTVSLARPASTAAIPGPDGEPLPGSVAELTTVGVNGHDLGLMLRGRSTDLPVLLFLAGGPGGSELGAMRRHLPALEEHFVVATWDQRGTGRSYGALDPLQTLTLEGAVADTLVVTDYLRERFAQDRIYLVGQSWGSTLGVLAVQQAPERYRAFVGVGQMVSQRATDQIYYTDTIDWASRTGREGLVASLEEIGPPPYEDPRHYETVLSHEMQMYPYDHSPNSEGQGQMSENLLVPEYSLTEQVRVLAGTLDTFAALYPQLQDIDFRDDATSFEIPVFFVQGAHEAPGRAEVFDDWYPRVEAPDKDLVVLETSGHRPLFEQPEEFVRYLSDTVVPRTTS